MRMQPDDTLHPMVQGSTVPVAASRRFRMACAGLLPSTVICRRWQEMIGVGDEFFPLPFL